jgi:hypothetical protein
MWVLPQFQLLLATSDCLHDYWLSAYRKPLAMASVNLHSCNVMRRVTWQKFSSLHLLLTWYRVVGTEMTQLSYLVSVVAEIGYHPLSRKGSVSLRYKFSVSVSS